jgi:hypothetical protein
MTRSSLKTFRRAAAALTVGCALSLCGNALAGNTPTPTSSNACSFASLTQPFQSFGDNNSYFLAPGANFEGDVSGWTLAGGAAVSSSNEDSFVGSSSDSHSLALPTTSAAVTTPTFCVTANAPTFRMFIQNSGNVGHNDGQLAVYLNFSGADGKAQQVKIGGLTVKNTKWTLTAPISFIQYISTPLKNGYANISFTIKPNDNHGNWLLDDLYVDPFCGK